MGCFRPLLSGGAASPLAPTISLMCRKSKSCVLLGDDPSAWSKTVSLSPPAWFDDQASVFEEAVRKAATGDRAGAIQVLRTIRSDEMREWFDEHGQVSGRRRVWRLNVSDSATDSIALDPVRSPQKVERGVFERDSYRCRYCGVRIVAKEVLRAFERVVGTSEFRCVGTNAQQHGVIHAFKVVADHVVPHKRGGRTNLENLVTSCPGCNYGKENFTLAQLGLADPRDRLPLSSDWDGLTSLMTGLQEMAR